MFRSRGVMKLGSVAFGAGSFLFFFRRGKFVINHRKSHVLLLDSDHNCVASKKQNLAHRWFLKSLLISQNLWGSFITTALCKAEIPFNFQNWLWKKKQALHLGRLRHWVKGTGMHDYRQPFHAWHVWNDGGKIHKVICHFRVTQCCSHLHCCLTAGSPTCRLSDM